VDKGGKAGECLDYLGYAGNPEKSSGAFSEGRIIDRQEKSEIRKELKSTKSCVWDYVVSASRRATAKKIRSWRDAQALIAKEFPKFLKANGMDVSKVRWFAGLHENTDNRHIHLCFYELEPERIVAHQSGRRWHRGKMSQSIHRVVQGPDRANAVLRRVRPRVGEKGPDGRIGRRLGREDRIRQEGQESPAESLSRPPPGDFGYASEEADPIRQDIDAVTAAVIQSEPAPRNRSTGS
jgi:hypothetical protein